MRKFVVYGAFAALALLLGVRFVEAMSHAIKREQATACSDLEPLADGRQGMAFELQNMFGQGKVSLASLRGKLVFLNFWATWCPPCVDEMPSMEKLARRFTGRPFQMVAYSVDEKEADVKKFFPSGTSMTVIRDANRDVAKQYGTDKFPETYLIDGEGRILYKFVNKRDWSHPAAARCIEANLPRS